MRIIPEVSSCAYLEACVNECHEQGMNIDHIDLTVEEATAIYHEIREIAGGEPRAWVNRQYILDNGPWYFLGYPIRIYEKQPDPQEEESECTQLTLPLP